MAKSLRPNTSRSTRENQKKRNRISASDKVTEINTSGSTTENQKKRARKSASDKVTEIDSQNGISPPGKHHYNVLCGGVNFEIDKKYIPIKLLGMGSYGFVCSATNAETGETVAIKRITNAFENPTDGRRTLRELRLLRHLNHENIISVKDVMKPVGQHNFRDVYVVTNLMGGDLNHLISSRQKLMDKHVQYFIYQILCGLKYVHSANVIHRDLKPQNLLVNEDCTLKICDFGLARTRSEDGLFMTQYVQTLWYRAPELLLCADEYSNAIDMWSVGCILAELLGRKPIFPGEDPLHQLRLIIKKIGSPEGNDLHFIDNEKSRSYIQILPFKSKLSFAHLYPSAKPLALDLLDKLLVFDPRKRITAKEALEHPYMSDFHEEKLEPSAPASFEFDFENEDLQENELKEEVWNEILLYHPQPVD